MKTIRCTHFGAWVNSIKGKSYLQIFVVRERLGKKDFTINARHLTQCGDGVAIVNVGSVAENRSATIKLVKPKGGAR